MAWCRGRLASVAVGVVLGGLAGAAPVPLSPEETVRHYLQDMKDGNFDDAYDLVSKGMRRGKDEGVWAREQKAGMACAGGKVVEFDGQAARVEGDTARVRVILSCQAGSVEQTG